MLYRLKLQIIAVALLAIAAPASAGQKDIVDTAVAAGNFKTLTTALTKAGLVDTLKGKGPFTVFAPTDEAFAKLPKGTVESLIKPENKARLTSILTYHVVAGRVPAKDVVRLSAAATLNGQRVDVKVNDGTVMIDGAKVVTTDIACSNGIIHVIDSVILPSENDIVDTAVKAGSFNTLAAALEAAGLVGTLKADGPFTVFAPTDDAFAKLPKGTVESLLLPENRDKLVGILKYHVAKGRVFSNDLPGIKAIDTLQGQKLMPKIAGGKAMINNATVAAADIDATNGVIHVIDTVLLPSPAKAKLGMGNAREVIRLAIDRGVPMFNHGNHGACAAIYEMAATCLIELDAVPTAQQTRLATAIREMRQTHDESRQAWIMRHALDEVDVALQSNSIQMGRMADRSMSR